MDKIYVVIPVLNRWTQTERCLDHLRTSLHCSYHAVVVDHGSTDETKTALRTRYPEVLHIEAEPTLWWTGATNLGIKQAVERGAKAVMLLNNDCYVTRDTLARLSSHASQNPASIIAPVQFDAQNGHLLANVAASCFLLGFPTIPLRRKLRGKIGDRYLVPTKLILGGRGVIIPTVVFERVGVFDELNLPHYGADHDFYLRCQKRGIPLFIATDASVLVDGTRTTLATGLEEMNFRQFIASLKSRRSHRNVSDLVALFKAHYPLKGLHHIGVALNIARYTIVYLLKRILHGLSSL